MVHSFPSYSISSYYGLGPLFELWRSCFSVWGRCHTCRTASPRTDGTTLSMFIPLSGWVGHLTGHGLTIRAEKQKGSMSVQALLPVSQNADIPSVKTHHVTERYPQLLMGGPQPHCEGRK